MTECTRCSNTGDRSCAECRGWLVVRPPPDPLEREIPAEYFGPLAVPRVVALLEHLLQGARCGEIRGVAVAWAERGQVDANAYALGGADLGTLVLATERLRVRLVERRGPPSSS